MAGRRIFSVGDVMNCPRSRLPRLKGNQKWVEYCNDGYAWQVQEVRQAESTLRYRQLILLSRKSNERE